MNAPIPPPRPAEPGAASASPPAPRAGVLGPAGLLRANLSAGAWRAAALLPAFLFLLTVLQPPLNHDVAAVLNFSQRWLAGERLYSDLIDVNPPLIFVLNLIPAAIAEWTPLDGVSALLLCLCVLAFAVWWLCGRLRAGRDEGPVERAVLSAVIPLALVMSGYDFGQREVIMGTVALPYALLASRRMDRLPTSRALTFGTALLAAVGFALKPHFLAVPALVELAILTRRGWAAFRDPVPWTMLAVWLLYLASLPVLFPDYLGHVVPLVWDYYLDLGGNSALGVLLTEDLGEATLLLLMVSTVALLGRWGSLVLALWAAAFGAFFSAWVQHKGWTYHAAPIFMLTTVAAATIISRWMDRALPPARARATAPALAAMLAAALCLFMVRGGEAPFREINFENSKGGRLTAWLKGQSYGERLLILTPDIFPIYPALNYAHAQSTLRTMNMWLLQGVYRTCPANGERYRQPWEMSRAEFFVYRTVAEDFARAPPSAVLITRHSGIPWCGQDFDFIAYFSRHPLFAEAWKGYRQAGEIEGYKLYVREE